MANGAPKDITQCRRFFEEPAQPRQRMYEALRAYFLEGQPSQVVARTFGYSPGAFRVLCHQFRRDPDPQFFVAPVHGPRTQPKKSTAHDLVVALRKQNHSVYEIAEALKEQRMALSPTAVRELLQAEGFAPLPRRMDEERPATSGHGGAGGRCASAFCLLLEQFIPAAADSSYSCLSSCASLDTLAQAPGYRAQDDSGSPCAASVACAEVVVDRAQEPRNGTGSRPGIGAVCGAERVSEEELSVRVFLARGSRPNHGLLAAWQRAMRTSLPVNLSTSISTPSRTTGSIR